MCCRLKLKIKIKTKTKNSFFLYGSQTTKLEQTELFNKIKRSLRNHLFTSFNMKSNNNNNGINSLSSIPKQFRFLATFTYSLEREGDSAYFKLGQRYEYVREKFVRLLSYLR